MEVGVLGSGSWGVTLANLMAYRGHFVSLWSVDTETLLHLERYKVHTMFPDFVMHANVRYVHCISHLLSCDVIVESVTSGGVHDICCDIQKHGGFSRPFIITSKGIERQRHRLMSEVVEEILGHKWLVGILGGPTLAKEVRLGQPTTAVIAGRDVKVLDIMKELFVSPAFHVVESLDVVGVGVCSAMKNVIALVCGVASASGYEYNVKSFLISAGLQEMERVVQLKQGDMRTCYGLAGVGDVLATSLSPLSRNYRLGFHLGQGDSLEEAQRAIGMVIEGGQAAISIHAIGKQHQLSLPIVELACRILSLQDSPKEILRHFLTCQTNEVSFS